MPTYLLRVWLPDRPGALGAVASRIGAVRADVVGIDILERGAGRAIDELVVELPDAALVPLLLSEIREVDGVDVEDIRPVPTTPVDARVDALECAAALVEQQTVPALLALLVDGAARDMEAQWAAVVDVSSAEAVAAVGECPSARWLHAFLTGSESSDLVAAGASGPDDVAWAGMPTQRLALVAGRDGVPFRARERRQLAALARVADARVRDLMARRSMAAHPSACR